MSYLRGAALLGVLSAGAGTHAQTAGVLSPAPSKTQVVILGTGTPNANPDASGPAVAIVVNGAAYLVDCGPGVVRRAAAAERNGIAALKVQNLKIVFITHLHSDHTLGYPDLIFSPWVLGRTEPVQAYGPRGLSSMTEHIEKAWKKDVAVRTKGLERGNLTGFRVAVHEIEPGVVYRDNNVTVKAFLVPHGSWDQAFGYRFETADRSIVLSGDTGPTDAVANACNGCDVMLSEVYSDAGLATRTADWQKYYHAFHVSSGELAAEATKGKPALLVLYHQLYGNPSITEEELVTEVRKAYTGKVVSAHDLDVY